MLFKVWAPLASGLAVRVNGQVVPLAKVGEYHVADVPGAKTGDDYAIVMNGIERPDPRSRHQPFDVHGASRIVGSNFSWTDGSWSGLALEEYIIYELHIGTFSPEGTFDGAVRRLDHLLDLGITAVELMPVAEFPGGRNWGYDGAHLYAVEHSYGGPDRLRNFVNECHARGIAVILDVVYNHLGPEGNYLAEFGPFFTNRYRTPWGDAINYDGEFSDGVRRYVIENALYWLEEFHIDALRLDAIHAIHDFGATHILEEMAAAFHDAASRAGRRAFLIAESSLNDPRIINPRALGGYEVDAQWNDEFHHAVMGYFAGRREGYFMDFGGLEQVAKAITHGFVHDGGYSKHRKRSFGRSSKECPGKQFVIFLQNHDQIANASHGKRLHHFLSWDQEKIAATLLFVSPNIPMLFMGQEFHERAPFEYFVSHSDPELCRAVAEGRLKEYEEMGARSEYMAPDQPGTFEACRLNWEKADAEVFEFYQRLIVLRRAYPALHNCRKDLTQVDIGADGLVTITRRDETHPSILIAINLSSGEIPAPVEGEPLFSTGPVQLFLPPLTAAVYDNG